MHFRLRNLRVSKDYIVICCKKKCIDFNPEKIYISLELCSQGKTFWKKMVSSVGSDGCMVSAEICIRKEANEWLLSETKFAPSNSIIHTFRILLDRKYEMVMAFCKENKTFIAQKVNIVTEKEKSFFFLFIRIFILRWYRFFTKNKYVNSTTWKIRLFNAHGLQIHELSSSKQNFADPFLVDCENGDVCLFYEVWEYEELGKIGYSLFTSNGELLQQGIALSQDVHLSYPYIFYSGGEMYMFPQGDYGDSLKLFRCKKFPDQWVFEREILFSKKLVDPFCFFKNGIWWILATARDPIMSGRATQLEVYFSDDLLHGNFSPHPLNPVLWSDFGARNGGNFNIGNELFRVGQIQGSDTYGFSYGVFKILDISKSNFEEELQWSRFNLLGEKSHHLCVSNSGYQAHDYKQHYFTSLWYLRR